jgi:putative transposase
MARLARFKVADQDAWYHLHCRIAGSRGDFPLSERLPTRRLAELIEHFSRIYFCDVATFSIMGNHYHLVVRFEGVRGVPRAQLRERARLMYPSAVSRQMIDLWTDEQWERFRQRLFDVSELMRNIQAAFARWYNRTYDRRGRFWADRFKSVYLEKGNAVLDCMLYVELNPVRAGLVERPEEWVGSSLHLREIGKGRWLLPLREVIDAVSERKALVEYRARLYYRGNVPTKHGQAAIPNEIVDQEEARGFKARGVYGKRLGYFVDGVAIGTEQYIRDQIAAMREAGVYQRRKNPISHLDGIHFTIREQRSTAVVF